MILIILSILWGWSITSDGHAIQIGEILTNNQNIKIMKMNFNNPAWLQSAGNVQTKEYITMMYSEANQSARITTDGDLLVETISNGQVVTAQYSDLNNQTVQFNADANSVITLYGKVTALSGGYGPYLFGKLVKINTTNARSLTSLVITSASITSLDVSHNTALTDLACSSYQLTSLDVSHNTALTSLNCSDLQLTSLDVSHNTALTNLGCGSCQLTSLDVSHNTALTSLACGDNQLTSLDLSHNTALTILTCSNNQLTSLDISANTALTSLDCSGNQLTSLDLSHNTALKILGCENNVNITDIQSVAVHSYVASQIANLIGGASSVDGTVTLRQGDEFNQTIIDAAMNKGWDVQYYQ